MLIKSAPEFRKLCYICSTFIHEPDIFPDDFPSEWRWCCGCKAIACLIISTSLVNTKLAFNSSINILRRVKKVNEMINVN